MKGKEMFSFKITNKTELQHSTVLHRNILYFLGGSKIFKFPVNSCKVHQTCRECLLVPDPLDCGWCGDHCSTPGDCPKDKGLFSNNTCSPSISTIEPKNGPVSGGTLLTIKGDNFGSSTTSTDEPVIKIGGAPCKIQEWFNKRIRCRTGNVTTELQGLVELSIRETQIHPDKSYYIQGITFSSTEYQYKEVLVYSYSPTFGPMAGGTLVTFYGKNLDIGYNRNIPLGDRDCRIISSSYNKLVCKTQTKSHESPTGDNLHDVTDHTVVNPSKVQMRLTIDGIDIHITEEPFFYFKPNPVVTDISPRRSFNSGGLTLTVFGEHLDSVSDPALTFLNGSKVIQKCVPKPGGTEMTCKIPAKPPGVTKDLKLHFDLDGAEDEWTPCKTMIYLKDPIIYSFNEENRTRSVDSRHPVLTLMGVDLSTTFNVSDVIVDVGGANCLVTSLSRESMTCLTDVPEEINNSTPLAVQVKVGNLEFMPGYVIYEAMEEVTLLWFLVLPLPVVAIVIIVTIAAIKCRGQSQQKVFDASQDVVYRIPDIVVTTPDDLGYSTNSLDDLDKSFDRFTSSTLSLFEKDNLLIDRQHIVIEEELGKGYFGCVYKGRYYNPESDSGSDHVDVAIKTIRQKLPNESELNIFLEEALIMKDFSHEHVLNLIGVCLAEDSLPYIILPFMKNGDLLAFIRNPKNTPTIKDLILLGVDIAKGMEYLTRLKFIHRDLAARNCMLDGQMKVKVADFGLTRDVYHHQYYSCRDQKAKLPIKWMAIESVQSGTFTSMSDIWSYGVLLWELMTRGVNPYPDVDPWDMYKYLYSGRRLSKPEYCPIELYEIMLKCWNYIPSNRPSFHDLVKDIPAMLEMLQERELNQKCIYVNMTDVESSDVSCNES